MDAASVWDKLATCPTDRSTIVPGILKAFDSVSYKATVQVIGSLSYYLESVAVARSIASAEMVVGRKVGVILFDPGNPADAVVAFVYG